MKKRLWASLLALILILSLTPAAWAAEAPVQSSNKNRQDYSRWSKPVTSYLYENETGGLTRVEYTGGQVVAEDYDSSFAFQSGRIIQPELRREGLQLPYLRPGKSRRKRRHGGHPRGEILQGLAASGRGQPDGRQYHRTL